jgi:hypothetical protein
LKIDTILDGLTLAVSARVLLEINNGGRSMRFRRIFPITLGFLVAILSVGVVLLGPASSIAAKSSAQCDVYAKDYADHNSNRAGVVGGAANEAGRIVGGITGTRNPAPDDWNRVYTRAYDRCMNKR